MEFHSIHRTHRKSVVTVQIFFWINNRLSNLIPEVVRPGLFRAPGKLFFNRVNLKQRIGIKQNLDCIYAFPIDLAPSGIPFGAKSFEKV